MTMLLNFHKEFFEQLWAMNDELMITNKYKRLERIKEEEKFIKDQINRTKMEPEKDNYCILSFTYNANNFHQKKKTFS